MHCGSKKRTYGGGMTARRSYRRRVRGSPCRGKSIPMCRASRRVIRTPSGGLFHGCKVAKRGSTRYCRKRRNTRRKR